MGFARTLPILRFDPHARLVAVDELDAGFFEGVLYGFDGAGLQRPAGFQSRNCGRCDLGHHRKIPHSKVERGPRHSALGAIYEHGVIF
jgi:hypothetical protein